MKMTETNHNILQRDIGIKKEQLEIWAKKIFRLKDYTSVLIEENDNTIEAAEQREPDHDHNHSDHHHNELSEHPDKTTIFRVETSKDKYISFVIDKPLDEINETDIKQSKKSLILKISDKHPLIGRLIYISGWWIAFSGFFTAFSVCPFCGQPTCPVNFVTVFAMSGITAVLVQFKNFKLIVKKFFNRLFRKE